MKPLYRRLSLYTDGNEAYTFVPTEPHGAQSLTIYRNSGDIVLNASNFQPTTSSTRSNQTIYGIVGLITLSISEYIILITAREKYGSIMGQDIYRATEYDILPLNPNASVRHPTHPVEVHLLALVRSHLNGGLFFFSYSWDITRRLQALWLARQDDANKGFWEVADDRFFWNKFLQSRFIDASLANLEQDLSGYILPLLYGTIDFRKRIIHNHRIQLCLISRRSRYRAGTRYFRRGIDEEGHVANFNETEQMAFIDHPQGDGATQLSFVQTRGSIPVFWAEVNTLRYKPDLQIMDLQETAAAMRSHLQEQIDIYGEQSLINLVNQKGHEAPVKEAYERYVKQLNLPKVKYQYFDFHNECKHMRWDRISVLISQMEEDFERQGYFCLDSSSGEPTKMQTGSVRTNCMDNLDRTNVAQAAFAKGTLTLQLRNLGIFGEHESVDDHDELATDLREMWTDHADLISKAYSGTGALKTDFTRTGKRTKAGALEDGYKSILRYLKNNFFDGVRQDAFDLMTGEWMPRRGPSSAQFLITDGRPLILRSLPYTMCFSVFMICAGLTLPRTSDYSLFYYFILWFSLFMISFLFIFIHGIEYVSWPRLIPATDTIYYNGPGFRSGNKGKGLGIPALDMAKWTSKKRSKLFAQKQLGPNRLEEIEMGSKKRVD